MTYQQSITRIRRKVKKFEEEASPKKLKTISAVLVIIAFPLVWRGLYLHREVRDPQWWIIFSIGVFIGGIASYFIQILKTK